MAAPISVPSIPSLNSANLQLPPFQKANDGNRSILKFVNEQRSYARHYAKEGADLETEWNFNESTRATTDDFHQNDTVIKSYTGPKRNLGLSERAMLSSPLLKPRVPGGPAPDLSEYMERVEHKLSAPSAPLQVALSVSSRHDGRKSKKSVPRPSDKLYLDEHETSKLFLMPNLSLER